MAFGGRTLLRQGMHLTTLLAASTLSASALGVTSSDPRPGSMVIWTRLVIPSPTLW